MKIEQYPNVKEAIESFYEMSYSIAALEEIAAKSLPAELFAILDKIKTCRAKIQCCFLKIMTDRNIYINREGLIYDLFMSHKDLPRDWKCSVCGGILDGAILTNNLIEIYSNFHEPRYREVHLSKKELRDKALLRCEKDLLFMTIDDNRFEGALKVYYSVTISNLTRSLPRYAVRWRGILENRASKTILEYGINSKENTDSSPSSFYYKLGALDLLSEQYNELPSKQVEEVLSNAMESSHREIRKRAYQVGAEIFGRTYYEKGLEDPSSTNREWIHQAMETGEEYIFKRGRLRKERNKNQLKLF
ncbi:MAG: hypothetical protein JRE23_08560 [Deltaproteobacteria bacterium]|nr:hypothetical protein [Deltaproteobacteria bacterium]